VKAIAKQGAPEDTLENRRLGWQRMCLLVLYFSPSGEDLGRMVGDWLERYSACKFWWDVCGVVSIFELQGQAPIPQKNATSSRTSPYRPPHPPGVVCRDQRAAAGRARGSDAGVFKGAFQQGAACS
jgi:hypothetical protein